MAKLEDFIAFQAALALHEDAGTLQSTLDAVYARCSESINQQLSEQTNHVQALYAPFTTEQLSDKIAALLTSEEVHSPVKIIFQTVEGLHNACPDHLGDWYFTGNYPTPGGNRVVNRAFMNFYEGKSERAY